MSLSTFAVRSIGYLSTIAYMGSICLAQHMIGTKIYWNKCFHKEQYSILGGMSADKCLEECIISGSQCKAVAYERLKTVCRLYHDVDVSNVEKDSYTCVGSNIVYRNNFTKNEADVCGQNSCPKRDCGPFPEVQKATEVLGNLATIGTKRLVVCESNKRIQVMCLETGEWSHNETMCLGSGGCSDVTFVTRETWGAQPWTDRWSITSPVSSLIIHHTENVSCTVKTQCMEIVRKIQNQHMDKYRWADIGYNFLIGEDGNVYEARDWGYGGASEHSTGNKTKSQLTLKSLLVSMIGNFETRVPKVIALIALKNLIKCGVQQGNIAASYRLYGHRNEANTSCPGTSLYEYIQTLQPHSP